MASKNLLSSFLEFVLPKKKATTGGKTYTNTFKPGDSETLSLPEYQQYLDDIQEDRLSDNEFELIDNLDMRQSLVPCNQVGMDLSLVLLYEDRI